jgi:hypothetical protein
VQHQETKFNNVLHRNHSTAKLQHNNSVQVCITVGTDLTQSSTQECAVQRHIVTILYCAMLYSMYCAVLRCAVLHKASYCTVPQIQRSNAKLLCALLCYSTVLEFSVFKKEHHCHTRALIPRKLACCFVCRLAAPRSAPTQCNFIHYLQYNILYSTSAVRPQLMLCDKAHCTVLHNAVPKCSARPNAERHSSVLCCTVRTVQLSTVLPCTVRHSAQQRETMKQPTDCGADQRYCTVR